MSGYIVVLASATNRADDEAVAERAPARSPRGVLRSDNYASLKPGYWVAFCGQSTTADEARRAAERLRGQGFAGAYARHGSDEGP